jgi:hypothetical protein
MTNKQRIKQLEKTRNVKPNNGGMWLVHFSEMTGLVESGSAELIGMTREQVDATIDKDAVIVKVGIDLSRL